MPTKPLLAAAFALATLLAASNAAAKPNGQPYMGGPDNFGEANRQTMAAQIIDPNPVYADPVPASIAEQVAKAVERYRTDKIKRPERQRTSNTGVGGSVSGGGGSGN